MCERIKDPVDGPGELVPMTVRKIQEKTRHRAHRSQDIPAVSVVCVSEQFTRLYPRAEKKKKEKKTDNNNARCKNYI